ncbi:LapA family protein [Clostridium sp. DL1XJH146]
MQIGFIFSLLFAILVTIFALQNATAVNVNFLFANVEVSQALVIFISAVAGAIIFAILGFYRELKIRGNLKKATKQITQLENEKVTLNENISKLNSEIDELKNIETPNTQDAIEIEEEKI